MLKPLEPVHAQLSQSSPEAPQRSMVPAAAGPNLFEGSRGATRENAAQRKLASAINSTPAARQLKVLRDAIRNGPGAAQLKEANRIGNSSFVAQRRVSQRPDANRTGLPDKLRSGMEALSGMSLDHVKVHYNSPHPSALNALAYAQGSDIHVAPGQEKHLPHEAWHIVQQAQGRVGPTAQLRTGVSVNDDRGLEGEADAMGAKAVADRIGVAQPHAPSPSHSAAVAQRMIVVGGQPLGDEPERVPDSPAVRVEEGGHSGLSPEARHLFEEMRGDGETYTFRDGADLVRTINVLARQLAATAPPVAGMQLPAGQAVKYQILIARERRRAAPVPAAAAASASSSSAPLPNVLSELTKSIEFARSEAREDVLSLLLKLRTVPADLEQLDEFTTHANTIYGHFDHRLSDQLSEYSKRLHSWAARLQGLVYALRDDLLIGNPAAVQRYGLSAQYARMFPLQPVPAALSEIDRTMGTIVFSTDVQNDCGRFANLLLEHRKRDLVKQFIERKDLNASGRLSTEHQAELLAMPEAAAVRSAKLDYRQATDFPYPHHAKTSLATEGDAIYTLEAHKGKPFLPAPELRRYASNDEFLESEDLHIETRTETTLSDKLANELPASAASEEERFRALEVAGGSIDVTTRPIGRPASGVVVPTAPAEPREESSELRSPFDALAHGRSRSRTGCGVACAIM